VPQESLEPISIKLAGSPVELKAFLMKHHYNAAQPSGSRPFISMITLGLSYLMGGLIPLLPYIIFKDSVRFGLYCSIGVMVVVLILFGYCKTCVVRGWRGTENIKAGLQGAVTMLGAGAAAAGASAGIVYAINQRLNVT